MKKAAFIFPGQGSQHVGMGKELYNTFQEARDVFDEIDDALSEKLSEIIFNGDPKTLNLTINAQPAIMATSLAVMRVILKQLNLGPFDVSKICPIAAGHSLGEYSTLCAGNVMSISDCARLLRIRGQLMQNAADESGGGGMLVLLGADVQKAEKIALSAVLQTNGGTKSVCSVANDNGAGQVVLSGHTRALNKAMEIAKEYKVKKAILLPVSGPFHSSLMKSAAISLRPYIETLEMAKPTIPVLSNYTATTHPQDPILITELLIDQVIGMVRWREIMEMLLEQYDTVVEVGPGQVLGGLAGRMLGELGLNRDIISVSTPEEVEVLLKNLSSKWMLSA